MPRRFLSYLVLITLVSSTVLAEELISYQNPVRTSADDEVKNLPGLDEAITFRQYSGYLKADKQGSKFLHYWFVEAADDPSNRPVLLWLNGGPGCSSMEGLFSELGPLELNSNGSEVKLRKYSWNKLANVIFLESPAGVGFSYSTSVFNTESDDSAARENYLALKSFYEKFPQYKSNPLYLSGESYAGVYLPTLGVLVDADKEMNLRGIAIGNGYLDAAKLEESLLFFSYHHGLLGKTFWDKVSRKCCDNKPPAREVCDFGHLTNFFCSYQVFEQLQTVLSEPGFNPYNMYGDCPSSELRSNISRWSIDSELRRLSLERRVGDRTKPFEILKMDSPEARSVASPPCFDGDNMIRYLNEPNVRAAIHIPKNVRRWEVCANLNYAVKYPTRSGGLAPQMKKLIASPRKLLLLVFNGDTDLVCNSLGDEWFVDDLGRKVIADYRPWRVGKQIGGYVKHYDGIAYATVRGSGHMVPEFRPKEAYEMIKQMLYPRNHTVFL